MKHTTLVFLFPADPITPKQVDYDYEQEYTAAANYCEVRLIELDKLTEASIVKLNRTLPKNAVVIYRGWMLTPEQYGILEKWARNQDAILCTSLQEYTNTHLSPSWSDRANTLHSRWSEDLSESTLIQLLNEFSSAVTVKDFVKSRKHEWAEAFFIPDPSDTTQALRVIRTFIERQGEQLVGGIVLREFIELKEIGHHPKSHSPIFEEYRVFYWRSIPVVIIDYWNNDTVQLNQQELAFIAEQGQTLASSFFTIDYGRKANGELAIMEIGDGQVSGLQEYNEEIFYEKLFEVMKEAEDASLR